MSDVACATRDAALGLVLGQTDACATVLSCGESTTARVHRRASRCRSATAAEARRAQSLFGTLRRTYAAALHQHPSLPVELQALVREPPTPIAARGSRPRVEVVIERLPFNGRRQLRHVR